MLFTALKSFIHEENASFRMCFHLTTYTVWCRPASLAVPVMILRQESEKNKHPICFLAAFSILANSFRHTEFAPLKTSDLRLPHMLVNNYRFLTRVRKLMDSGGIRWPHDEGTCTAVMCLNSGQLMALTAALDTENVSPVALL